MKIEAKGRAAKWAQDQPSREGVWQLADERTHDLATLVSRSLPEGGSAVLAVSGGMDSMALLDLAAAVRNRRRCTLVVATFDHGSGPHSTRAAGHVAATALGYGLPIVMGAEGQVERSETAWRAARWRFLRSVARSAGGPVITAHTRDDQIETVLMRALRGAGARGLAGLRANSTIRRPFLDVACYELRAYAEARSLRWIEDPSNRSVDYLRNRLRRDLLPALARVQPSLGKELLDIGERAAEWRRELAALVDTTIRYVVRGTGARQTLDVAVDDLVKLDQAVLRVLWAELAGRAHVTLDRRGISRAAEFTLSGKVGGRIQLSGGWALFRSREWFELRPEELHEGSAPAELLTPRTEWGSWRFSIASGAPTNDPWRITLPQTATLAIRRWRPGDRLAVRQGDGLVTRKVKYFLSDARISGHNRARWPVVLAGDEIVWIPGVRRSDAATVRSGGPVVTYVCDYLDLRS